MYCPAPSPLDPCILMYHDAVATLGHAHHECQKTSNVDIRMMLKSMTHGTLLAEQIKTLDSDPVRLAALDQLVITLKNLSKTLSRKIKQLDESIVKCGSVGTQKSSFDNHEHGRRRAIEDTLMSKGHLTFTDVAGLEEAKGTLSEAVIMPVQYPHLFTGGRKPWKRILLYGPPGTGKSRLAQALSSEIKSSFYSVSSSDLISSWVGESEKLIKELFAHAVQQRGRSVVFVDEIDSICRKRSSSEEEHTRRVKTELLRQLEGVDNTDESEIFFLCATNCPWELDSAFLRRFQKRIYIPLPSFESRIQLMKIHTRDNRVTMGEEDWRSLSEVTVNYSGSDLATVVLGALFEPVREMQQARFWHYTPSDTLVPCAHDAPGSFSARMHELPPDKLVPRDVNLQDFMTSLNVNGRTITLEDLAKFEQFTSNFGENGSPLKP